MPEASVIVPVPVPVGAQTIVPVPATVPRLVLWLVTPPLYVPSTMVIVLPLIVIVD